MQEPTWIIHCVFSNETIDSDVAYINAHTHGLEQYGHLDFQVVIALPSNLLGYILNTLGDRVRNGEVFKNGETVDDLLQDLSVRLDEFEETGRTVLRVILPDEENLLWPEHPKCSNYFKGQLLPTNELM